jgi:CYTH domain-containing protein
MGSKFEDEIERKFLVRRFLAPECDWAVSFHESVIHQTYLSNGDGLAERVRLRHYLDSDEVVYTHTLKKVVGPGHFKEAEREIEPIEYTTLKERQEPGTWTLHKIRKVFEWRGLIWELDVYQNLRRKLPNDRVENIAVLEVENAPPGDLEFPAFLDIERELTGAKHWSNHAMAKQGWSPGLLLRAGQVWSNGEESFQVLWADGKTCIRAAEERRPILGPAVVIGGYASKPVLQIIRLDELEEEGWSLASG